MEAAFRRKTGSFDSQGNNITKFEDESIEDPHERKKIMGSSPLIVFIYDFFCVFLCFLNVFLWDSINKNLFRENPLTNFVILNIIALLCKFSVFSLGLVAIFLVYKGVSWKLFRLYGVLRVCETFFVGTMKFVYCVGLANFTYQNYMFLMREDNFTTFFLVFCIYNTMETLVLFAINAFFCKIVWKTIAKKCAFEDRCKEQSIEMQANLNAF